jgi:hypothetical protein
MNILVNVDDFVPFIKIKIDHIRHAFSCANSIYAARANYKENHDDNTIKKFVEIGKLQNDSAKITPDSVLTDLGVKQAKSLGHTFQERFNKADMVICSELRRCMETSVLTCQNILDKIYVVPYVAEVDTTYDNCAIEFNEPYMKTHIDQNTTLAKTISNRQYSQEYMKNYYPSSKGFPIIDNSILLDITDQNNPKPTVSDHNKFYLHVIPAICDKLMQNKKQDNTKIPVHNILLFTHNNHIKKHFGLDGKPLGSLDMTKDERYRDRLNEFVNKNGHPYNTNIYTELIEVDKTGKIRVSIAKPCDCVAKPCTKFHQITLRDQHITTDTHWHDIDMYGVQRCVVVHDQYTKYYDKIKNNNTSSVKIYKHNKSQYYYLMDLLRKYYLSRYYSPSKVYLDCGI